MVSTIVVSDVVLCESIFVTIMLQPLSKIFDLLFCVLCTSRQMQQNN